MTPFIFYLGTVLETFIFQEINQNWLYYDAGQEGYKIRIEDDETLLQLAFLMKFIPLVNLLEVFYHIVNYNLNKDKIMENLKEKGLMEPFTKGDRFYYSRDDSISCCKEIANRYYKQRKEPYYIIFVDEEECCKISYIYDFPYRDIIILGIEGTMANLTLEDQKKIVKETVQEYEEVCVKKCGGQKEYFEAVREGYFNPEKIIIRKPDFGKEMLDKGRTLKRKNA